MTRIGAGISTDPNGVAAARAALRQALTPLAGVAPDLVFAFIAPQYEDEHAAMLELVNASVEGAIVLGCSAAGVIGVATEIEDAPAISIWAASLPDATVVPFRVTFERDGETGIFEGLEEIPGADEEPVVVMVADPFSFPADLLLDHLNRTIPGVPILGGMASGGLEAGRNRLFFNDTILRDGAVGAVLTGLRGAAAVVSQGCRPIGETFAVTRAERNVIYELAGAPAMKRLEEVYNGASERDQILIRRGLHVGQAVTELKPELRRGDFLIRNVMGVDAKTGAIAISDMVEVGQTVQFQVRDAESARQDLRELLERERVVGQEPVAGALLFSCNGRGQALFGNPDHDVGAVHRAFGDVPVAGFFAAGELGPVGGRNFLHGFTASVLLLR